MCRFALLLLLLSSSLVATGQLLDGFKLSIDGLQPEPFVVELDEIRFGFEVVEVREEGELILRKRPGREKSEPVTFVLPEIGDEVAMFHEWFGRLSQGREEGHHAAVTGFDQRGAPVVRWRLVNSWPSKIAMTQSDEDGTVRIAVTLQSDEIFPTGPIGNAPPPRILSTDADRDGGTFTLRWSSVADATYAVYGWDLVTQRPIVEKAGIVAVGAISSHSLSLRQKGLFWVVMTAPPP